MVERVTKEGEIYLGGTYFPIIGQVRPSLVSTFPGKVVIGDYSLSDELLASNWVINNQRGGILIEEMDEKVHQDRCYWSNCNIGFKEHIVLPPLVTDCGTGILQTQVSFVAAGTGSGVAGNVTPAYPAGMTGGDLMILQVTVRHLTDTPTTPTNWTALYSADATSVGRQWLYYKVANGEESGTLTVTTNSVTCCIGRIYAFRNVAISSFTEGGSFGTGTDTTIEIPSIITVSTKRLAVAFVCVNDDQAVASATGETGGDWTEAAAEFTTTVGEDGCVQLQTAEMATAGTITGGVTTITAFPWGVRAFALIPFTPGSQDVYRFFELDDEVYAFYDRYLQKFDNTNDDFNDNDHIFRAVPTDVLSITGATLIAFGENENIYQKGLPSLARNRLIDNFSFEEWESGYPTGWGFEILGGTVSQNTATPYIQDGLFSVKLNGDASVEAISMRQKLPFCNALRGKTVTLTAYGQEQGATTNAMLYIEDGTNTPPTVAAETEFGTTFGQTTVQLVMPSDATALEIGVYFPNLNVANWICVDKVEISISGFTDWLDMGTEGKYFTSLGDTLYMVNDGGEFCTSKVGTEWVYKTEIPIPFGEITSLFIDRDAYGDSIVCVGTQIGIFAYDSTYEELVPTDVRLPKHPTAALHPTNWRTGVYIPAGLDVLHYISGSTATITSVGLDKEGGLPIEYRGEITYLEPAYNEFFTLVDSTYGSGTSYSALIGYDGLGWQPKWVSSTANKAAKCAFVTSAYSEYRLFWGADNRVYHMALDRNLRNPLKLSTYTYGASGIHITPWFDADWIGDKLALKLSIFCKNTTSTETVQVSYRIDHSSTTIGTVGTEWTSLGMIAAAGNGVETEYAFASSVGLAFQSIQFRFDLARGSTNTLTPDVQWVKLKYLKLLDAKWGWDVTVDCSKEHKANTPSELITAIKTLAATQTLGEFTFRDGTGSHTYYAKIINAIGTETTGKEWNGRFELKLMAF